MTKMNKQKMAEQIVENVIDCIEKNAQNKADKFVKDTKKKIFSRMDRILNDPNYKLSDNERCVVDEMIHNLNLNIIKIYEKKPMNTIYTIYEKKPLNSIYEEKPGNVMKTIYGKKPEFKLGELVIGTNQFLYQNPNLLTERPAVKIGYSKNINDKIFKTLDKKTLKSLRETATKLISQLKKSAKKAILPFAFLAAFYGGVNKANAEENLFKDLVDRVNVSVTYTNYLNADPMKGFYDQLNTTAKNGGYTTGIPMTMVTPQFKEFQSPKLTSALGGALDIRVLGDKKDLGIYVTGDYSSLQSQSNYNETYNFGNPSVDPINLQRTENISLAKTSFGAKIKKNIIENLGVFLGARYDIYNVKGDEDMTIRIRGPPDVFNTYKQWREADFEGKGSGFSAELGAEYQILPNVSLGVSGGVDWGKVECSGKEVKTASTNPGKSWEYDYNPSFNFNNSYVKGGLEIKF